MKYLGLINWFDNLKGFGEIAIPHHGDVFIHKNNFTKNLYLNQLTALIFEIKQNSRGYYADNVSTPNTFNDFKLIISYIKENPKVTIKIQTTRSNKWGLQYPAEKEKYCNLIIHSLNQLFKKKDSEEIYNFFKSYFDEQKVLTDSDFIIKYISLTRQIIYSLKPELKGNLLSEYRKSFKNQEDNTNINLQVHFLIQKLFKHYTGKLSADILFDIWQNKYQIIPHKPQEESSELIKDILIEIPTDIFVKNYKKINKNELIQIYKHENGKDSCNKIISEKIKNSQFSSPEETKQILECIRIIEENEESKEGTLKANLVGKYIEFLIYSQEKEKTFNIIKFKSFVDFIKTNPNDFDYDNTIQKFNSNISDTNLILKLWKETKYFNPDTSFFKTHILSLEYSDFLAAPIDFHENYIKSNLLKLEQFNYTQSFCRIIYISTESPYNIEEERNLIDKFPTEYKILYYTYLQYLINLGKKKVNLSNYPTIIEEFSLYLKNVNSLDNLISLHNLLQTIIQYHLQNKNKSKNFFNLNEDQQKNLINDTISIAQSKKEPITTFYIFSLLLSFYNETSAVLLCRIYFPKFLIENKQREEILTKIVLDSNLSPKCKQDIFNHIGTHLSKLERVSIWLEGHSKEILIEEAFESLEHLGTSSQIILLRKLFSIIQKNKITKLDKYFEVMSSIMSKQNLDINVKLCLHILVTLHKSKEYINEIHLSNIICEYINEDTTTLMEINDFFQECTGRIWNGNVESLKNTWAISILGQEFSISNNSVCINNEYYQIDKENKSIEIEGERYNFKWVKKENNFSTRNFGIPKGVTFCDAVQSKEDLNLKKVFYWCCNQKCYSPNQSDNIHLLWKKYSLRDFIKILNIPFEEDKYYRFLGLINRVLRLLEKIKCTSCTRILRDSKTSEFAFYRVTSFHCTKPECSKFHELVYLNHCLNWKCNNVVDSRISTVCPNGWYICDSCNSCCSHAKIEQRYNNLLINRAFNSSNPRHQKLKFQFDNKLGHLEKDEKFDFKTGERLYNK